MSRGASDFDMDKALRSMDFSRGHRKAVRDKLFAKMNEGDNRELDLADLDEVAAGFAAPFAPDDPGED